ncbi:TPA: DUF262 domain-containing protein [Pseudomonas aeruginosa]|nr:DUF262 domain-containing protein [Pseudomonas aeruginosa]
MQINPSVTNPDIVSIYNDIQSKKLVLAPVFQRKFVWTSTHQEEFIDTILQGYPFPEIYISQGDVDTSTLSSQYFVIDGQQRLTTIKNYIEGNVNLRKTPPYKDLTEQQQKNFLSYKVVVRNLGAIEETIIREIFRRINLTKFKLDEVEIHNAVYDGEFITTAKKVLDNVDLRKYEVFHESEFTRMADLHFILLVMATIENNGYFPGDNEVEGQISRFNEEYPRKDEIIEALVSTFGFIDSLDLPPDSIWFRKSNFFTMTIEILKNFPRLSKEIKDRMLSLEEDILRNKNNRDNIYGMYYSYMYAGTTGRKARVVRAALFNHRIFDEKIPPEVK